MTSIEEGIADFRLRQLEKKRNELKSRSQRREKERSVRREINELKYGGVKRGMTSLGKGLSNIGRAMAQGNKGSGGKRQGGFSSGFGNQSMFSSRNPWERGGSGGSRRKRSSRRKSRSGDHRTITIKL